MTTSAQTSRTTKPSLTSQGVISLFCLFAGLCTVFALIVSLNDAWREHVELSWPQTTATIKKCSLDPYVPLRSASRTPVWHIQCRLNYSAESIQIENSIRSRSTTAGWGGHIDLMAQWVANHPSGSPIVVHYNPSDTKTAVLTDTDMPDAGPRTPNNMKLLLLSSVAFVGLFTIARLSRSNP